MRSSTLAACLLACSLGLAPVAARAQEASDADIAQARQLGEQAIGEFNAGNYAESEKHWSAAARLYPKAPTLSLGLARAAAKNGHVVLAQEQYNKIIREWGNVASPPPAFKEALEAARREVGDISKRVAFVVITIDGGATSPTVTVDGVAVPPAALGTQRPVDGGTHAVHAEAPGYKAVDQSFQVAEGGNATATLKLEKSASSSPIAGGGGAAAAGSGAPAGADGVPANGRGSDHTLAIVALGVGGAGLVFGAVTGFLAIGKHSDLSSACQNGVCAPDKQSDIDSYKTMGTLSTIGFIVGGVGVAAGAVLWLTAPKETASKGPSASPYVGLGSAGVAGRF